MDRMVDFRSSAVPPLKDTFGEDLNVAITLVVEFDSYLTSLKTSECNLSRGLSLNKGGVTLQLSWTSKRKLRTLSSLLE